MTRLVRIEKGIEIPPRSATMGRRHKYPWATIQPGDSFAVKTKKRSTLVGIYSLAQQHGMKVTIRPDGRYYRVWRVDGMKAKKK